MEASGLASGSLCLCALVFIPCDPCIRTYCACIFQHGDCNACTPLCVLACIRREREAGGGARGREGVCVSKPTLIPKVAGIRLQRARRSDSGTNVRRYRCDCCRYVVC